MSARTPTYRRLQTRLFGWLIVAIVLAVGASFLTAHLIRKEQEANPTAVGPIRTAARNVAGRLARSWDDVAASEAYVARLREDSGIGFRLVRDPAAIPKVVLQSAQQPGSSRRSVAFDGEGHAFVPIVRDGAVVGALTFDDPGPPARVGYGAFVGLGVAILVLALAARHVSARLARPIEDVARSAERFGRGELGIRTRRKKLGRWTAAEVVELATTFDTMADRIEKTVRDQRELLAAISHELRSPLGRARVALEIGRDRAEEGISATQSLDEIERQLGDVDAILGDLLAVTRAGLSDVRREPVEIVAWLRARIVTEPSPPAIELTAPEGAIVAPIDAALLARALHNMISNARRHGHPPDAPIEVRVETVAPDSRDPASTGRVRVVVRDRGPGFAEDLLPRAFDPFVRGDAARTPLGPSSEGPGHGSGLGLALVRRIAEAHHGIAFARNAGGEGDPGAEVGFELPIVPVTNDA